MAYVFESITVATVVITGQLAHRKSKEWVMLTFATSHPICLIPMSGTRREVARPGERHGWDKLEIFQNAVARRPASLTAAGDRLHLSHRP